MDSINIEQENCVDKLKRDELQGTLAFGGRWIIAIYDLDEHMIKSIHSTWVK